jgi:hypothetical protein
MMAPVQQRGSPPAPGRLADCWFTGCPGTGDPLGKALEETGSLMRSGSLRRFGGPIGTKADGDI